MKQFLPKLVIAMAVIVLAGCKSRKVTVDTTEYTGELKPLATVVELVNANRHTEECVTARMSLNLHSGKRKIAVGGTIKMKRNDVIQISMVAFGVVEACRIEMTKDYFVIIDRLGRRFVKESYKDIPFFAQAGINFYTFQSLFWDELFVLGSRGDVPLETMFTKTIDKDLAVLRNDDSKSANLTFYANLLSGLIRRTNICSKDETQTPALNWEYVSYTRLGTSEFPSKMEMELTGTSIPLSATLTLAKVQANDEWEKRTEVSKKRFTQISIQEAFSRIFAITY